ncbi:MAG: hypothetical protein NT178_18695 [Proteobacteria bacterium]|nr:hypothetical protein [Pseudomonadota bacterium]
MWFNNLQILKTISQWLFWSIVLIPALLAISKFIIDKRIDNVKDRLSKEQESQYQTRIGSLQTTIKTQDEKLNTLDSQLQSEKLIIRDFASIVKVIFSGKWSSKPYPIQIMSPINHQYYLELQGANPNNSIKFYATQPYHFQSIDNTRAVFESRQAVNTGSFPLGKSINDLSSITEIQIHVPFILHNNIEGNRVAFHRVEVKFVVNGKERHTLLIEHPYELPIIDTGSIGWANLAIKLAPNALSDWLLGEKG